jgi:AMP-activated protein kinase-like protein
MTHRIDDYLDGALDRIALTPDERADADALERAIEQTRAFVDGRPAPDLIDGVMRRVHQLEPAQRPNRPSAFVRLMSGLWAAREVTFQFRAAYGIAAAAAAVALAIAIPGRQPVAMRIEEGPKLLVQFRLQADQASNVKLAGSFTQWQPQYELHQTSPGIWAITLPLPLGVHDYAFVVDGQRWVADPYAQAVDDGFGGTNSRIAILPPDQSRS